jgi:hypothetical protein
MSMGGWPQPPGAFSEKLSSMAKEVHEKYKADLGASHHIIQANINCSETIPVTGRFYQVDISILIIEYKRDEIATKEHLNQLAMNMTTSLHQLRSVGLSGPNYVVFGMLITRATVNLHVGWMDKKSNEVR